MRTRETKQLTLIVGQVLVRVSFAIASMIMTSNSISYGDNLISFTRTPAAMDAFVHRHVRTVLTGIYSREATKVATTILEESRAAHFDPIFVMAVIENESSFKPSARGSHGEIGLMQLRPQTAQWIAHKHNLPWHDTKTLQNLNMNIKLGVAYLTYLKQRFPSQGHLFLDAYNMGVTNVKRAMSKQVRPREYSDRVMKRYQRFYAQLNRFKQGPTQELLAAASF